MELIVGGGLIIIGFVLGRIHRPAKRPPKPPKKPEEICQCGHASSFHDQDGCHFVHYQYKKEIIGRDGHDWPVINKTRIDDSAEECSCRRYVGPNSLWVPELEG